MVSAFASHVVISVNRTLACFMFILVQCFGFAWHAGCQRFKSAMLHIKVEQAYYLFCNLKFEFVVVVRLCFKKTNIKCFMSHSLSLRMVGNMMAITKIGNFNFWSLIKV